MAKEKENQIKFDPGSPIGCGVAIIVFAFAIVSLNWGFFTSMTDWGLKDGENLPFYHLYDFKGNGKYSYFKHVTWSKIKISSRIMV